MRIPLFIAAVILTAACVERGRDAIDTSRAKPVDAPRVAAKADTAATATEQCVRGEPEPVLEPPVQAVFQRTSKLEATEDARVADTLSLLIRHGGCAHFSEIYAFTVTGAANNTGDSQRWLRLGAQLLRRLNVVDVKKSQMEEMAGALEKAAEVTTPYIYGDPISVSEMVTLYVTARPVRTGVVMEITYSNTL
jgi:hypothetical protein